MLFRSVQAKKDQQIEVEKFVDREYSRTKEAPDHWPVSILGDSKAATAGVGLAMQADEDTLHPFYNMSTFRLRHQSSMIFPDYVMASTNYFNRAWTGLRRLKNVIMILEWVPSVSAVAPKLLSDADIQEVLARSQLAAAAGGGGGVADADDKEGAETDVLRKAYELLSFDGGSHLTPDDVRNAIDMASFSPTSDTQLAEVMAAFGSVAGADGGDKVATKTAGLTFASFRALLESGRIFQQQTGRYWVAVNLAEAATLRRLIHVKHATGQPLIPGRDAAISLRYSPAASITADADAAGSASESNQQTKNRHNKTLDSFCGIVFDGSTLWRDTFANEDAVDFDVDEKAADATTTMTTSPAATAAPRFQRAAVHACFRFFDNDAHFSKPQVNTLIRTLQDTPPHLREKFFLGTMGCRRRMALKPTNTALRQIFQIERAANALKQRAHVSFLRRAIAARGLTLYEAFLAVDANSNGYIDPSEMYGAMDAFGVPATGPEDLVDFYQICDAAGSGAIDYRTWLDIFDEDAELEDEHADDKEDENPAKEKVDSADRKSVV